MNKIIDDIKTSSEWIAKALRRSGYNANFRSVSLLEIDRFLKTNWVNGLAKPMGYLDSDLGYKLFALGAYIGEIARVEIGGSWLCDENDKEGEINAQLILVNKIICWPMQRILKFVEEGEENSIYAWGLALGINFDNTTTKCSSCRNELPAKRKTESFRQFFWGGWTCKNCKLETNRFGRVT